MPGSQLKRLKASLHERGILGPQNSRKQKKQAGKSGTLRDSRIARNAALEEIREQFNPFEAKLSARGSKYQVADGVGKNGSNVVARPGVTKGLGEETVSFALVSYV